MYERISKTLFPSLGSYGRKDRVPLTRKTDYNENEKQRRIEHEPWQKNV